MRQEWSYSISKQHEPNTQNLKRATPKQISSLVVSIFARWRSGRWCRRSLGVMNSGISDPELRKKKLNAESANSARSAVSGKLGFLVEVKGIG